MVDGVPAIAYAVRPMITRYLAVALVLLTACSETASSTSITTAVPTTPPATSAPAPTTTPATSLVIAPEIVTYEDLEGRFAFEYRSTWEATVDEFGDVTVWSPLSDEDDSFTEYVEVYAIPVADLGVDSITAEEFILRIAEQITASYDAVEVLSEAADQTDGVPDYGALFQVLDEGENRFLSYSAAIQEDVVYVLGYVGADEFQEHLAEAALIAESFRWLGR